MRTIQHPKSGEAFYELRSGQLPAVKVRLFRKLPKGYVVDEHQGSVPKGYLWVRSKSSDYFDGYHVALIKKPQSAPKRSSKSTFKRKRR